MWSPTVTGVVADKRDGCVSMHAQAGFQRCTWSGNFDILRCTRRHNIEITHSDLYLKTFRILETFAKKIRKWSNPYLIGISIIKWLHSHSMIAFFLNDWIVHSMYLPHTDINENIALGERYFNQHSVTFPPMYLIHQHVRYKKKIKYREQAGTLLRFESYGTKFR